MSSARVTTLTASTSHTTQQSSLNLRKLIKFAQNYRVCLFLRYAAKRKKITNFALRKSRALCVGTQLLRKFSHHRSVKARTEFLCTSAIAVTQTLAKFTKPHWHGARSALLNGWI